MDVLRWISSRLTPQSESADPRQVENSAGGYTFELDDRARLRRFLTLGVDGGTYYASDRALALENAAVLTRMAVGDPEGLVATIVEVSARGAAPKQNPALFALAFATSIPESAPAALAALPQVARTGTHLLLFAAYVEQFRGWGRGLRRAVGDWYMAKAPDQLAYQVVKYRQRESWSHRDLLRLAHPTTGVPALKDTFDWIVRGTLGVDVPRLVQGFAAAQAASEPVVWAGLVREYGLSWEMLPDAALGEVVVWDALLDAGIPQTALLRQLPRLTRLGMLPDLGGRTSEVTAQLTDVERLRAARVHPVNVLVAQRTYASGRSARGAGEWTPTTKVVDALDAAFYAAFGAVEPSGKRTLLAVDVSGSMGSPISGMPLTAREASAALALVQLAILLPKMDFSVTSPRREPRRGVTPRSSRWRSRHGSGWMTRCGWSTRCRSAVPIAHSQCCMQPRRASRSTRSSSTPTTRPGLVGSTPTRRCGPTASRPGFRPSSWWWA